jgi:hypothetical protein
MRLLRKLVEAAGEALKHVPTADGPFAAYLKATRGRVVKVSRSPHSYCACYRLVATVRHRRLRPQLGQLGLALIGGVR